MSVLSDLFTDIADAIRTKTGEEGTMKPIDFPDKIAGITTGGTGVAPKPGEWKRRTFTFTPNSNPFTVFHGCGVVPDWIQIYIENNSTFAMNTEFGDYFYIEGFSKRFSKFLSNDGSINFFNNNIIFGITGSEEFGYTLMNSNLTTTGNIETNTGVISLCSDNSFTFKAVNTNLTYTCVCYWFTGIFDQVILTGVPEFVKYVTFMNGDVELYKMPFIKNFDCPNPITEGLIETPTKESTQSTVYTFNGWDNDLTDLTEDVIVNATFTESIRYYTINFYDGETLLESQSVAYGKTPSITKPEKDGYSFSGWNPELSAVTGNVDYYAVWSERVTFAGGTWADIARISEAGQAEEYFNLGDTKDIVITDGTKTTTITVQIVGFNHDDLSDGSGKAGLSIMTKTVMNSSTFASSTYSTNCAKYEIPWSTSKDRKYLMEKVKTWLPQDLQAVLKTVNKISSIAWNNTTDTETTQDELWYPSYVELTGQASSKTVPGQGTKYEYFTDNTSRQKNLQTWTSIGTQLVGYGTRSHSAQYSGYKMHIYYTGVGDYDSDYTEYPFGFCV